MLLFVYPSSLPSQEIHVRFYINKLGVLLLGYAGSLPSQSIHVRFYMNNFGVLLFGYLSSLPSQSIHGGFYMNKLWVLLFGYLGSLPSHVEFKYVSSLKMMGKCWVPLTTTKVPVSSCYALFLRESIWVVPGLSVLTVRSGKNSNAFTQPCKWWIIFLLPAPFT